MQKGIISSPHGVRLGVAQVVSLMVLETVAVETFPRPFWQLSSMFMRISEEGFDFVDARRECKAILRRDV
jgi:hypothetical protein